MEEISPKGEDSLTSERTTPLSIRRVFEEWNRRPLGMDARIAAMAEGTLYMFDTDPRFNESVQFMIESHEDPDTSVVKKISRRAPDRIQPIPLPLYAAHLIRVGYQNELLHIKGIGYPEEFVTKEKCLKGWRMIIDNQERYFDFSSNIAWRPLQTNIADRYKGVKAVILNQQHRFKRPINYLDVGASLGNGCKKLAMNDSFRPIEKTTDWYQNTALLESKPRWNDTLNRKLTADLNLGECIGIDIMPGNDPKTMDWIYSCSFYPSELLDETRTAEFMKLEAANPKNFYGVVRGDFSHEDSILDIGEHTGRTTFDIISFVTVLGQASEEDRQLMLKNALNALSPEGLIIIQDFVNTSRSSWNNLAFFPEWGGQYSYRTIVIDPSRTGLELHEALYWQNSRCEEVRVSKEYGSLLVP